jgi:hypothetical protein
MPSPNISANILSIFPNSLMALPPTQNANPAMAISIHASPRNKAFQNDLVAAVMLWEEVPRKPRVAPKYCKIAVALTMRSERYRLLSPNQNATLQI